MLNCQMEYVTKSCTIKLYVHITEESYLTCMQYSSVNNVMKSIIQSLEEVIIYNAGLWLS